MRRQQEYLRAAHRNAELRIVTPGSQTTTTSVCSNPLGALSRSEVAALNAHCDCLPLPRANVDATVAARWGSASTNQLLKARADLFASTAVFVSEADWRAMQAQINAIEAVVALPGYQRAIAARTPGYRSPRTPGVFMGYDFHLSEAGPMLIEINTNAGGAMLATAALAAATQKASRCGPALADDPEATQQQIVNMLIDEWRSGVSKHRDAKPHRIAIVDHQPTEQYLYPDMLLTAQLLAEHGIDCVIADPGALSIQNARLLVHGQPVDLVYNRLTDFYLEQPEHRLLKRAHEAQLAVVSPAPEHHASYADKRNLGLFTRAKLAAFGASPEQAAVLENLPRTTQVTPAAADALWAERKKLFFKPHAGYGSRAVYRGSKLTRKVWQQILGADYLAQPLIEPGRRAVPSELGSASNTLQPLKFDVRLYTYKGTALLTTARLYQGQTTNFRTQGGGFAPVVRLP